MRRFLPVLLLLLLLAPPASAAPNPEIGYLPGEDADTVAPGSTASYEVTILVAPPDGKTRVDVEFGYDATSAIAPPTRLLLRRSSESTSQDLGVLQGTTQRVTKALTVTEPRGFEYILTVQATVPANQPPGDFTSRLAMLARDPSTSSSSPGILYDYLFHVPNTPPLADFTFTAQDLVATFDGRASRDPAGEALTYAWDFGDGSTSTQAQTSHAFHNPGAYAVTLTVSDPHGATGAATKTVTLTGNFPPNAAFRYTVDVLDVAFDGTLSSDADGSELTYIWDFGDSSTSTVAKPTHHYAAEGTYSVRLTVRDPQGGLDTDAKDIAVTADNHVPAAGFTFTADGLSVAFTNTASDPDGDVLGYAWDFGDGGTASSRDATHTYAQPGTYRVRLEATDPEGAKDTAVRNVAVSRTGAGAADTDGDGISDAIEAEAGSDPANPLSTPGDRDGDGKANDKDNCPGAPNASQADRDGDGIGDACDGVDDGANADPDADGIASGIDNCPARPNADQADLDGDKRGDRCDSDIDDDGAVNEADAFPSDEAESLDTDHDGQGNNADADDDGDGLTDAQERAQRTDPLDRQDPSFRTPVLAGLRLDNGTNLVAWKQSPDARVTGYLVWREASPLVLLTSLDRGQRGTFWFFDEDPPAHARYHIQATLSSDEGLLYDLNGTRTADWLVSTGPSLEECKGLNDTDEDGLCDEVEVQLGLDPHDRDTDGDGLTDGEELRGRSLPFSADSDGDGVRDGRDLDPLSADAKASKPFDWKLAAIVGLAVAVVALAFVALRRRKP